MNKTQLKHIVRGNAILSKRIDNAYPDKRFIKVSRVNALIDSELSDDVKNSSDHQRHAFSRKLNASAETVKTIKHNDNYPDIYVDLYTMEIVSTCIVSRMNHMKLINALIHDHRIDIVYRTI